MTCIRCTDSETARLNGGERCQDCGDHYLTVYAVPDDVWEQITPKAGSAGLLCPRCAERRARRKGIYLEWSARASGSGEGGS